MAKEMRLKRRELILFGSWLIIVISVGGYLFLPRFFERQRRLDDQITLAEQKLARLRSIVKQENSLNAQYASALAGYRPVKDSDSLLQEIDAIARKMNVNILSVKPGPSKDEATHRSFTIKIEGQDDVGAVARFLFALLENLRSISIDKLQVSAQAREELPKVSITVNALVFK